MRESEVSAESSFSFKTKFLLLLPLSRPPLTMMNCPPMALGVQSVAGVSFLNFSRTAAWCMGNTSMCVKFLKCFTCANMADSSSGVAKMSLRQRRYETYFGCRYLRLPLRTFEELFIGAYLYLFSWLTQGGSF